MPDSTGCEPTNAGSAERVALLRQIDFLLATLRNAETICCLIGEKATEEALHATIYRLETRKVGEGKPRG